MSDDPLENVYAMAERAYLRMQASEILMRCLDDDSVVPMQQLVESLLLAGSDHLDLLREILAETSSRKSQVGDDMRQVISGLKTNLASYGVRLRRLNQPFTIIRMKPVRFLGILRRQGVLEEEVQSVCLQLWQDARELVISLGTRYHLLEDMERYLDDWFWGAVYQSTRQTQKGSTSLVL